jgi:heme oxygenase
MSDIKELTKQHHAIAEEQEFVKTLMSGKIHKELYATYLFNLLQCYSLLEKYSLQNGLFRQLPQLERANNLDFDVRSLWNKPEKPYITDSTLRYIYHLDDIKDQPEKLFAHIYVRHMGDLYGGQMIKRKTPGPNTYLVFLKPEETKRVVRELINNYMNTYQINVVAEAKLCFEYATELFKEMNDLGKSYTVQE